MFFKVSVCVLQIYKHLIVNDCGKNRAEMLTKR